MCGNKPKEWLNWIPLAEYWDNTSYHTTIKTTPYQVVYGKPPPTHITYSKGDSLVEIVDRSLISRESSIALMKFHIKRGPLPLSYAQLPHISSDGLIDEQPFAVLDRRMARKGNVVIVYVLIQWVKETPADSIWESYDDLGDSGSSSSFEDLKFRGFTDEETIVLSLMISRQVGKAIKNVMPYYISPTTDNLKGVIQKELEEFKKEGIMKDFRNEMATYSDFTTCDVPKFDETLDPIARTRWLSTVEGDFRTSSCKEKNKVIFASNFSMLVPKCGGMESFVKRVRNGHNSNEWPNLKAIKAKPLKSIKEEKVEKEGFPNPKARVYVMTTEKDKLVHDVVTSIILVNSLPARVLYDSGATPIYKTPYRLAPSEIKDLMSQLRVLIDKGIIRPSSSPWGASILFVKKKDYSMLMCINYRKLNKAMVCRLILDKSIIVFIDDILVYSKSKEEHDVHLREVLETLRKERLYAKFSKYKFWLQEVEFLGHVINLKVLKVDPAKSVAMMNWQALKSVGEIRSFLDLAGYYLKVKSKKKLLSPCERSYVRPRFLFYRKGIKDMVVYSDASYSGLGCVLMQREKKDMNRRKQRWLDLLKDYDCEIHYHPGKANVVADALS
nr:hypothetical protein [Tanacetum cinerariifolium]